MIMENTAMVQHNELAVSLCGFDLCTNGEFGGEMTLADYYPEIRKVVSVSAKALPDSKYISDKALEIGGTLAFFLVYIGDDGALSFASYNTEYTQSFPIGEYNGGNRDIFVWSESDIPQCRVLAPRTVSLKARVKSRALADKKEDCAIRISGESDAPLTPERKRSLERLDREIETVHRSYAFVTDSVSGEESCSPGAKPVFCRAEAVIRDADAKKDSATVKGDVCISCLVLTSEGLYKNISCKLPFEKSIRKDGLREDDGVCAFARAAQVSAQIEGESQRISFNAEYDMDVCFFVGEELTVTEDIYSTAYSMKQERKMLDVMSGLCAKNVVVSVAADGMRKTEESDGDYVIDTVAFPKIERAEIKEGKLFVIGNCLFRTYIASGGEVITEETSSPIEYESTLGKEMNGEAVWHFGVAAGNCECRREGQRLHAKCDVYMMISGYVKNKYNPVISAVVGDRDCSEDDGAVIRVCYPEKKKRIWDICKECRCSVSETERINRLERNSVSDGSPIIVR